MFNTKDINQIKSFELSDMIEFKNKKVSLYKSSNPELTGKYFDNGSTTYSSFELAVFGYSIGTNRVFIKYPQFDFFIEMLGSGSSSRGTMEHFVIRNILSETLYPRKIEPNKIRPNLIDIFLHETQALLQFSNCEFNFMQREAYVDTYYDTQTVSKIIGADAIQKMISGKYLSIKSHSPHRRIDYYFHLENGNTILVHSDPYYFTYESQVCLYGNLNDGFVDKKIHNFQRYRDGGTTLFKIEVDGVYHTFKSPSKLGMDQIPDTLWDDTPIKEEKTEIVKEICKRLNILIAPEIYWKE